MKYSKLFSILLLLIAIEFNAQTWVTKATNFPALNTQVEQIAIANDNVVWSCKGRSNVFSKSVDGGNTWTSGTVNIGSSTYISSITAASALKAWVSVVEYGTTNSGVFATVDGGITWTKQPTAYNQSPDSFPNFIKFFDENNGITGGDPIDDNFEIYTTSNGGVNWTRIPTTNLPPLIIGEYGLTDYFDATQDGSSIWFGSKYGVQTRLFKSNNKGLNWTATALNINSGSSGFGLTFKDANLGFVYGKVNNVFSLQKTTDGGNTFTNIPTSGLSGEVTRVKCVPNNNMIVASTQTNGLSYCNHQSTETTIAFQPFTNQIFSSTFEFKNFYTGYAAGKNTTATNGIYKFNNTISLIGSSIGIPWTTDLDFITTDGINYTLPNYYFTNGSAKFRQNHAWSPYALDWSSNNFPSGVGVYAGPGIPVSSGTYTVNFNIATLGFSFVPSLYLLDEKFEGTSMPNGWTLQSTISDPIYSYTWEFFDAYDDVEVYTSPNKTQNEWLISPSYDLTSYSNLYLTFSPWIYINRADFTANVFDFNVLASSDGGATWATIWSDNSLTLDNFDQKSFYYRTITKSLKNYCGLNMNNVKIAFQFSSNGKASTFLNFVALMDVKISSDCPVTTLSKFNSNSISWFPIDDFSGTYEIEYGPVGFLPGAGTIVNGLSGTTYIFPSIMSKYDCYIRTNCGGSTSAWSKMTFSNNIQELTNSQTTSNSSTINWLGYSQFYQIEYGLGNFTQGTGILLDDISGQSYILTGLSANSLYKYYVRSKSVNTIQKTVNKSKSIKNQELQKNLSTEFGPWLSSTFTTSTLSLDTTSIINKFLLFPNPASSILKIQMDENKTADKIIITDLSGKKILEQNSSTQVDVQNLAKGMYVLEVFVGDKKQQTKFLKE